MKTQQLEHFVKLAQVLNYTKAAEQLYITQSTLSYSISSLEQELGFPLFERHSKQPVKLTPYGEAFLPCAGSVLQTLEQGKNSVAQMMNPYSGCIQLGHIHSLSYDFIPKILEDFYMDRKNLEITFQFLQQSQEGLMESLMKGEIDLAFAAGTDHPNIESVPVFSQKLFAVVPDDHPLFSRNYIDLSELSTEPVITLRPGNNIRSFIEKQFESIDVRPNIVCEVGECTALPAMVSNHAGIAIMPFGPHVRSCHVRAIPFGSGPIMERMMHLLWVKDRYLPPVAVHFKKFVQKHCQTGALYEF